MKKFLLQIAALLVVIFGGLMLSYGGGNMLNIFFPSRPTLNGLVKQVRIYDPTISTNQTTKALVNIEVADSSDERSKGLGGRQSLSSDSGMLFIFDKEGKYNFWMKGINFPLDFIWIKGDQIVEITTNVQPPAPNQPDSALQLFTSSYNFDKVLEVNGGFANSLNIKPGDKLEFIK